MICLHGVDTPVTFDVNEAFWENNAYVFYGYTCDEIDAELCGVPVTLQIEITPIGAPVKIEGYEEELSVHESLRAFYEKAAHFSLGEIKIDDLPYYQTDAFLENRHAFAKVVNNPALPIAEKVAAARGIVSALYEHLQTVSIPDPLKTEDGTFYTYVVLFDVLTDRVKTAYENALKQNEIAEDHEFCALLDQFSTLITVFDKDFNKHFKRIEKEQKHRYLTPKQIQELEAQLCGNCLDAQQQIETLYRLMDSPSVDAEKRFEHAATLKKLILLQSTQRGCAPFENKINELLQQLDTPDFLREITKKIASDFVDATNEWRDGAPEPLAPLSESQLASSLRLEGVHLSAEDNEKGVECSAELFFKDADNSLAGHYLTAKLKNGKITETNMMG